MTTVAVKPTSRTASEGPFFRPRRVTHVNLWVRDVQKVADFYRDVAGIAEAYRRPVIKSIFLSNNNTYHDFALMDVDARPNEKHEPGMHHFALELETEADLYAGYDRANEAGFAFNYTLSADVAHSIYGSDPDGNAYEVYADVKKDWREHRSGVIQKSKPDWRPGDTPAVTEACYPVNPKFVRVEDAVFHTRRVSHIALVARDFAGLYDTYTARLGLTPLRGGPDSDFAVLGGTLGERSLSLFRARPGRTPGLHHIGLEVCNEDDLDQARGRLKQAGITPVFEIDHPSRRCIYLRDPNGQLLQFYVDRPSAPSDWIDAPDDIALFLG
jgi:catechol 2,3-dioxygenase